MTAKNAKTHLMIIKVKQKDNLKNKRGNAI